MIKFWCLILFFLSGITAFSQGVGINPSGTAPHPSAMLDVESTSKGLLPPRLTTAQRNAIPNPAPGLMVFNIDTECMEYYRSTGWYPLCPALPTLTTAAAASITGSAATSGGQISNDGGSSILARGVCWSINPSPNLLNAFSTDGSGSGSFSSTLTGLQNGTLYYVRAYATNAVGTAYGNEQTFTTLQPPSVTTASASSIFGRNATAGGQVSTDGGSPVTLRGLCWSTSPGPTVSDSTITIGSGTGSFSGIMGHLAYGTVYYVRAFATNSVGTAYGNQVTFTTNSGTLVSITQTGTSTWTVPLGVASLEVLLVGGGGGGGGDVGGGGGGGQVRHLSHYAVIPQNNLTIQVAAATGHAACYNCAGQNGNTTTLSGGSGTVSAIGGVGGRGRSGNGGTNVGWNGGGGSYDFTTGHAGNGGFPGGNAFPGSSCGGGGGSGSAGVNATSTKAGNGGNGFLSPLNGLYYGGGGGGGEYSNNGNFGDGIHGGGRGGYSNSVFGQDGTPNSGGGGGGGPSTASMNNAGRGASGVVLLKY